MQDLKRKGQEQLAAVKWDRDASGARGEYLGYGPDYVCALSPTSGAVPVGRMRYQEIRFDKRGDDVSAAMAAEPTALGIEEVTQVFVYRRGMWE